MSRFNSSFSTQTTNIAGGKAFTMKAKEELVHAVLTTFLEDKYYESGNQRLVRIVDLIGKSDPEFVARLAIVARKEFNLRSVPVVLIGELAKNHKGTDLVKRTICAATQRVDDLTELLAYLDTPIPKQIKRGVRNAILKFDRYQLAKYQAKGKKVSLVDLFNLVHPKAQFANEEQQTAWKDLIEGNLVSFDTWETEIANAKDDSERTQQWERLILEDKMGYMALLRNLNNFVKYKISPEAKNAVIVKLTNPEQVKKSKQLPFRFLTAYENVQGDREYTDAISVAMDHAVANTPELPGTTLIGIDSSGSMSGEVIKKAAIFGATLAKANNQSDVIMYDTSVKEVTISSRTPVIDIAQGIERNLMGGGTNTALVFQYAITKQKKYDRIIILSDNESWSGGAPQQWYNQYKNIADPFVYAIDIQGYGTKDVTGSKVFHLCGWSDRLLDFVGQMEKGENLIKYIENYEIPA